MLCMAAKIEQWFKYCRLSNCNTALKPTHVVPKHPVSACILSSKRPWALEIDGQKTGWRAYTDKLFAHRIIIRGWTLTRENMVLP